MTTPHDGPHDGPHGDSAVCGGDAVHREVAIRNQRGLHARAAAKFVKLAAQFDAEIEVRRNDMAVSGQSIMGLMMLAAGPGCTIAMKGTGNEAGAAVAALAELVERKFDED